MVKKRSPENQTETASIITDYIRQYVGITSTKPTAQSGVFLNQDRILLTQEYQELAWYDLYAEVERDTHVTSIMQSAKLNVAGMKYDIEPHKLQGEKKASLRNIAIADFVKHALKQTGHFPQHLFNLMDALGKGFSCSEIIWKVTSDGVIPVNILNRPQRRIQFDAVTRTPKIRNIQNPYYGDPLPDKKFIVHRVSSTWENPFGDALDQNLYWMWLFKRMAFKFYMTHLEVGSSSVPIVKHPTNATPELKNEALAIAEQIRSGAYGRIPENFEVIWATMNNLSSISQSYETFIRLVNDEMSKCVNGQTLTSEAGGTKGSGSMALGNIHQGTQSARDAFRAEGLSATLNATLIKWIVDFNFGTQESGAIDGYPEFRFDLEQEQDLVAEAQIIASLSSAGYDVDAQELSDKFNYTITKSENDEPKLDADGHPIIDETTFTIKGNDLIPIIENATMKRKYISEPIRAKHEAKMKEKMSAYLKKKMK